HRPIRCRTIGSLVSKEPGREAAALPNFVSIAPFRFFNQSAYSPGFLGPQYAPLMVGDNNGVFVSPNGYEQSLKVQDLEPPRDVTMDQANARIDLLQSLEQEFGLQRPGLSSTSHQ